MGIGARTSTILNELEIPSFSAYNNAPLNGINMDTAGYEMEFIECGKKPCRIWYTILFHENDLRQALYELEKRKRFILKKDVDKDLLLETFAANIPGLDHERYIMPRSFSQTRVANIMTILSETHRDRINVNRT